MSLRPHYESKCYCHKNTGCCSIPLNRRTQLKVSANSTPTRCVSTAHKLPSHQKFVKIRKNHWNRSTVAHGLGHSRTNNMDYSRRNSTATTTTATTTNTLDSESAPSNNTASSLPFSSAVKSPTHSTGRYEYTQQRHHYECAQDAGQSGAGLASNSSATEYPSASAELCAVNGAERFYALQQFRLHNSDDCFSTHRLNELKMQHRQQQQQQQQNRSSVPAAVNDRNPSHSDAVQFQITITPHDSCSSEQQLSEKSSAKSATPYAMRQKLLQLRLQSESSSGGPKPGRNVNKYAALDKSLALRFQETY